MQQRVHEAEGREDGVHVRLSSGGDVASDGYATDEKCGARVRAGGLGPSVGGDGKATRPPPSGRVFQAFLAAEEADAGKRAPGAGGCGCGAQ